MKEVIEISYVLISLLAFIIWVTANEQKPSEYQKLFTIISASLFILMIGYLFSIYSVSLKGQILAQKLKYLGSFMSYYYTFEVYTYFCSYNCDKRFKIALQGMTIFLLVSVITFDYHNLFYTSFALEKVGEYTTLVKSYGPIHGFYYYYIAFNMLILIRVSIWDYLRSMKGKRKQSVLLLMMPTICTISYVIEKALDLEFDLVPFGIMIGLFIFMYLIYYRQLYDLDNAAKEYMYNTLKSGILVVDTEYRLKGANPLAYLVFPDLIELIIGDYITMKSEIYDCFEKKIKEKEILKDGEKRIYNLEVIDISKNAKIAGKALRISDITEEKKGVRRELDELNSKVLLAQIQPHFLFNSLTMIKGLVVDRPKEAKDAILELATFLRRSIDTLNSDDLVALEEEVETVRRYINVQNYRFGNIIEFSYVGACDFLLPAFSLQPLVENAVKYGSGGSGKGTLKIKIMAFQDNYSDFVVVMDNGPGFNEEAIFAEGKSHTGIKNVRKRLEISCNGELTIHSKPDVGTRCVIKIDREE